MSMWRVISYVVGKGCLLWPVCSLDKILLAFALFQFVLQGQTCLLLQVSLDFLHWHSNPLWWKGHLFLELVLEGLVGLHRTIQLQLLWHQCLGHRRGLLWCWMALSWKWTEFILLVLRLHPSTAFQTFFVDYEGYYIYSKGFLPTVVDIMFIWIKFTHPGPL